MTDLAKIKVKPGGIRFFMILGLKSLHYVKRTICIDKIRYIFNKTKKNEIFFFKRVFFDFYERRIKRKKNASKFKAFLLKNGGLTHQTEVEIYI